MKSKRSFVLLTLLVGIFSIALSAYAEAPVVDLSRAAAQDSPVSGGLEIDQEPAASSQPSINHQSESVDQRVLRLERQIANMTEMNLASKLEKMQQEMQQLHGQIEVQNHDLSQLKEQLRNFYQDLDQRVNKIHPDEQTTEKNVTSAENKKNITNESTTNNEGANKTKELQTYESAFNLLNKKDYEKAINQFKKFIETYPTSTYAGNAHYWLGEIFYLKDKPELANKEFQAIISNYPDNAKIPDATLKIALIAMDSGDYAKAKQNLLKVQKQFPGTTAAKIATLRLKEIKQKK